MKTFIYTLSAFVLLLSPTTCNLDPTSYDDTNVYTSQTANATETDPATNNADGTEIDPPIPAPLPK